MFREKVATTTTKKEDVVNMVLAITTYSQMLENVVFKEKWPLKNKAWPIGKKRISLKVRFKKLLWTYNKRSHQGICLELVYKLWLKTTSQGIMVQIPKINLLDLTNLLVLLIPPNLPIFTYFTISIGSTRFIEYINSTKSTTSINSI
jgi:hypothetical protein